MTEATDQPPTVFARIPFVAALIALVGLGDAVYLTVHHLTAEPVPCGITGGCEAVLTSSYAEISGIPLAAFGALAYFAVFSLAILTAFGNRRMWKIYGLVTALMAAFSLWLLYLQAFVIKSFCQFCLISAATSLTLFILFIVSQLLMRSRQIK